MKHTLFKYLLRKIKKNFGGFVTISIIVALGVGFLVGLLITTPDLQNTLDNYYDVNHVADITLKSTLGFDKKEAEEVISKNLDKENVIYEFSYQMDEHVEYKKDTITARTIYYDFDNQKLNNVEIIDGKAPKDIDEIAIQRGSQFFKDIKIGEKITIGTGEDEQTYKVTGIVSNPKYFAQEKEYSVKSPGRLDTIIYIDEDYNDKEFATDLSISFKDTVKYNTFSNKYERTIDDYKKQIEQFKYDLVKDRTLKIQNEIKDTVKEQVYQELVDRFGKSIADYQITQEYYINLINTTAAKIIKENATPEVYVLDRSDNTSFYSYKIQSQKTNEISSVFPFFFLAIAALITLSTLERMVTEDRILIGTLKSIGYTKTSISGVYLLYSFIAAMAGILVGTFIGIFGLPYIIYEVFCALYFLPPIIFGFDVLIFILATVGLLLAILLATTATLHKTLKEKPNALLTQKPIRNGGKILLERIPVIWNRFKFKYKSTIRNLFRFKKNGLMMIVGIAGSTTLVLAAFGLANSIGDVTIRQYNDIIKYNTMVNVKDFELDPFKELDDVMHSDIIYNIDGVATDDDDLDFKVISNYDDTNLNDYINFYDNGKQIEFNEKSVFVTSQLAEFLNLEHGDVFFFTVDGVQYNCKVTGIVENHVNNYLYMNERTFKNIFKDKYDPNCYVAIIDKIDNLEAQDDLTRLLGLDQNVTKIDLTYQNKQTYENLLNTLQTIVAVLIIFAGALEITSIYSLTNINISERTREIATLKVLGYRRHEVVGYVYRETTILAFVGVCLGLLTGYFFHQFLVSKMQMAGLAIGYVISPLSYLYAFLIATMFFVVVDLLFLPKLNNLSMTESLKSVE